MHPTADQLAALNRLWTIANHPSGQCRTVAKFLLGLYNGDRFPFDLTDFRSLDTEIFQDCLQVLVMDQNPEREVHDVLGVPGNEFERLAQEWRVEDFDELIRFKKEKGGA